MWTFPVVLTDCCYGENPNRVGLFHQYQVVLIPLPSDVLDMYSESLEVIGTSSCYMISH